MADELLMPAEFDEILEILLAAAAGQQDDEGKRG